MLLSDRFFKEKEILIRSKTRTFEKNKVEIYIYIFLVRSKKLKSIERINYTNNFLQQFLEGQVISQISKNHEV